MVTNEIIIFGIVIVLLIVVFSIILRVIQTKHSKYSTSLEEEIYNLKAKVLDQEKIIKFAKNETISRSTLDQIKKIEALESELKRQKRRVEDAKAIAQEAHKIKSEFLSNVRHEIRTPMNSIIVFAQFLIEESKDVKMKNYAQNIYAAGSKLLNMIDDIINLSSVEKGTFTFNEKPVDVKLLVQKIIKSQRDMALRKGLKLTLDIDDKLPDSLMLDEEKVEDIFTNLIENGVKFTDKGFVHVKLEESGKNVLKNVVNLTLTVEDSGEGIANEDKSKIFEIFENPMENKTESRGLGLSLNKRVAKQMNGDISFQSNSEKGTTFIFSLADVEIVLQSANSEEVEQESIDFSLIKPEGGVIIVVDKSTEVRELVRNSFFDTKFKILSFDNPRDAIDALKQYEVDLILIDIDTLISDDNAVLKILKGMSSAAIVTLTDKQIKDVDFQVTAEQLAGHLKKPLLKSELFKIAVEVLNREKKTPFVDQREEFEGLAASQIELFLEASKKELNILYKEARRTHDLEQIREFSKKLLELSTKSDINELSFFAKKLLEKTELFEIDDINSMMIAYEEKISRLKNSIV